MKKEEIIQRVIDKISAKLYLEIGVQRGKNFYKIDAPQKIAIDPKFLIGYRRRLSGLRTFFKSQFFEMTSDQFFSTKADAVLRNKQIDVAFIDGLHTYEQSLEDFNNCLKYLSPNGVIFFHDCNPASKEAAERATSPQEMMKKFSNKNAEWNGDVWKTIVHIRSMHSNLRVFVFDCDFGLGVVMRGKPDEELRFSIEEIAHMDYEYFDTNRYRLLNLKDPQYLHEFICAL